MNETKTETIFDKCRRLEAENARLRLECDTQKYRAMVIADTAFEAKYEAMRKVADAAVAYHEYSGGSGVDEHFAVSRALADAIEEYRKLTEPPPLEQRIEAAIERAAPKWEEEECKH